MANTSYFAGLIGGIKSLCTGLGVTFRELWTPKITERYPENRKENHIPERFRGTLVMPHNENNEHKCIGCGICQMQCPNGTIKVETEMVETADGKKKKQLVRYVYDHGCCMYCMLCTRACPQGAIEFSSEYEGAVFARESLFKVLNQPGSKCVEKPARPAAAKPAAKPAAAATEGAKPTAAAQPQAADADAAKAKAEKMAAAAKKAAENAAAARATANEAKAAAEANAADAALQEAWKEAEAKALKLETAAKTFAQKAAEAAAEVK
ncbi:MAG: 4Fe-4S binding protein [Alloprevotella sp.]